MDGKFTSNLVLKLKFENFSNPTQVEALQNGKFGMTLRGCRVQKPNDDPPDQEKNQYL